MLFVRLRFRLVDEYDDRFPTFPEVEYDVTESSRSAYSKWARAIKMSTLCSLASCTELPEVLDDQLE